MSSSIRPSAYSNIVSILKDNFQGFEKIIDLLFKCGYSKE